MELSGLQGSWRRCVLGAWRVGLREGGPGRLLTLNSVIVLLTWWVAIATLVPSVGYVKYKTSTSCVAVSDTKVGSLCAFLGDRRQKPREFSVEFLRRKPTVRGRSGFQGDAQVKGPGFDVPGAAFSLFEGRSRTVAAQGREVWIEGKSGDETGVGLRGGMRLWGELRRRLFRVRLLFGMR